MSKQSALHWLISPLILAVPTLFGAVVTLCADRPAPMAVRSNGERIWLDGVSVGWTHRLDRRSLAQRLMGQQFLPSVTPTNMASPRYPVEFSYQQDWRYWGDGAAMGVWLRSERGGNTSLENFRPFLEDEHGCRVYNLEHDIARPSSGNTEWRVVLFSLRLRSSRQLTLRDWKGGQSVPLFTITNPRYIPSSPLKPEAFPIKRKLREGQFTVLGTEWQEGDHPSRDLHLIRYRSEGECYGGEAWTPLWTEVSNASSYSQHYADSVGDGLLTTGNLCTADTAWKLRLVLERPAKTHAKPDVEITTPPLSVVPPTVPRPEPEIYRKYSSGGATVEIGHLRWSKSDETFKGRKFYWVELNAGLQVPRLGAKAILTSVNGVAVAVLYRQVGMDARKYSQSMAQDESTVGNEGMVCHLPFLKPPKRITLRFAIHRHQVMECRIAPAKRMRVAKPLTAAPASQPGTP